MKTINPKLTKAQMARELQRRRNFLTSQLQLWAWKLEGKLTSEQRELILARMFSALRELSKYGKMNDERRKRLVEALRSSSVGEPTDIRLDGERISISDIDIDTDRFAEHAFW